MEIYPRNKHFLHKGVKIYSIGNLHMMPTFKFVGPYFKFPSSLFINRWKLELFKHLIMLSILKHLFPYLPILQIPFNHKIVISNITLNLWKHRLINTIINTLKKSKNYIWKAYYLERLLQISENDSELVVFVLSSLPITIFLNCLLCKY